MSVRNSRSRFVATLGQCYRKDSGGAELTHIKRKTSLIVLTTIELYYFKSSLVFF